MVLFIDRNFWLFWVLIFFRILDTFTIEKQFPVVNQISQAGVDSQEKLIGYQ
jgi:hypothetical protein